MESTPSHPSPEEHYAGTNYAGTTASVWRPLRGQTFRNLLIADIFSDVGTFMQSVGAAWLMVSLNAGPMYVALTQTASALPFFLFALPAGALGDICDRRKLILFTEIWMASRDTTENQADSHQSSDHPDGTRWPLRPDQNPKNQRNDTVEQNPPSVRDPSDTEVERYLQNSFEEKKHCQDQG